MNRIPSTLRSYNIATMYVMQDKIQNDMMYGEKASRAIPSNLSYQFFGKVNDPDTAKYCKRFFEIVRKETTTINRGYNLDFDTRITPGEKEVSKIRADTFFRLKGRRIHHLCRWKRPKGAFLPTEDKKTTPGTSSLYCPETPGKLLKDLQGSKVYY